MAATPEKKVKDAVKKVLDANKVWYFAPASNGMGRAGIPDIICCVRGYFLAIECKAGKGKTTALQDREIAAIIAADGAAIVVNETNLADVQEWVNTLATQATYDYR
jgi:ABC-type sulfate/molybdate transport systems ATPase subunit